MYCGLWWIDGTIHINLTPPFGVTAIRPPIKLLYTHPSTLQGGMSCTHIRQTCCAWMRAGRLTACSRRSSPRSQLLSTFQLGPWLCGDTQIEHSPGISWMDCAMGFGSAFAVTSNFSRQPLTWAPLNSTRRLSPPISRKKFLWGGCLAPSQPHWLSQSFTLTALA